MKVKQLLIFTACALLGVGAIGTIAAHGINPISPFTSHADVVTSGSYTLTAADFTNGAGNLTKGGETWHYDNASVSGDVVTITGVMFTTTHSGTSRNGSRRGDGYTRMVFSNLDN